MVHIRLRRVKFYFRKQKNDMLLLKGKSFVDESVLHHSFKKVFDVGTYPSFRNNDFTHLD